jgi:lipopolysaccharide/colanic/teichoic acid biosynthesis glycosyltransferase
MEVAGQLSIPPAQAAGSSRYPIVKRVLDVVIALLLLIVLSLVLLLCALAVRLDSPGPILFRQRRAGEQGRPFTMLKFRTMRANADSAVHRDYAAAFISGKAAAQKAGGEVFKLVADARVTRVGRWLRRTSLDELPQLWNVLVGEMSLVGPRPPIPYELAHYQPAHLQRLSVTPGMTGLWQVGGRSSTTFEEMVELDLQYIRRRSLLLDLRILLTTIPVVLSPKSGH